MKYIIIFLLLSAFACTSPNEKSKPVNVIPLPNEITAGKGNLVIKKSVSVYVDNPEVQRVAELFRQQIKEELHVIFTDNAKADIQLVLSPDNAQEQSYSLVITKKQPSGSNTQMPSGELAAT